MKFNVGYRYLARRLIRHGQYRARCAWLSFRHRDVRYISFRDLAGRLGPGGYQVLYPPETVELRRPPGIEEVFRNIPGWLRSEKWAPRHELAETGVACLRDGRIFGEEGWIGPDENTIVEDLNCYPVPRGLIGAARAVALSVGRVDLPGVTVSLLAAGWRNYYHWMIQVLPRLLNVLKAVPIERIDRFLLGAPPPFVSESLRAAGIPPGKIHVVRYALPVFRCECLYAAGMPYAYAPPPARSVAEVRALFGPERPAPGAGRKLHLGRGASPRRRLVNEAGFAALLARHGIETVAMDSCTVAEQARIVSGAELIVAVHGAALANLVFAREGATVVELLSANDPKPLFWHLAQARGLTYLPVVSVDTALPGPHSVEMNNVDMVMDLAAVERALGRAASGELA